MLLYSMFCTIGPVYTSSLLRDERSALCTKLDTRHKVTHMAAARYSGRLFAAQRLALVREGTLIGPPVLKQHVMTVASSSPNSWIAQKIPPQGAG